MTRKKRSGLPKLVPALPKVPHDPEVCNCCGHGHGTPGTRCERHGKFIERRPTEEEILAAMSPVEHALANLRKLIGNAEGDPIVALKDAVEQVEEALAEEHEHRDEVIKAFDLDPVPDDHADLVKAIEKRSTRAMEWTAICEANNLDPDEASDALIDTLDEKSPLLEDMRREVENLLDILGISEHDWSAMSYTDKRNLRLKLQGK